MESKYCPNCGETYPGDRYEIGDQVLCRNCSDEIVLISGERVGQSELSGSHHSDILSEEHTFLTPGRLVISFLALIIGVGILYYIGSRVTGRNQKKHSIADNIGANHEESENKQETRTSSQNASNISVESDIANSNSKNDQIKSWLNKEAAQLLQKFEDRTKTALNAPRFALSGHINELKSARREWQSLSPPNVYMQDYKDLILSYMNNQITALTNFMADDVSEIPLKISQYEKAMAGDYLYHVLKKFNIDHRKIQGAKITTFSNKKIALKKINTWQNMFRSDGGQFIRTLGSGVMDRQLDKMDRIEKYIKKGPWVFKAEKPSSYIQERTSFWNDLLSKMNIYERITPQDRIFQRMVKEIEKVTNAGFRNWVDGSVRVEMLRRKRVQFNRGKVLSLNGKYMQKYKRNLPGGTGNRDYVWEYWIRDQKKHITYRYYTLQKADFHLERGKSVKGKGVFLNLQKYKLLNPTENADYATAAVLLGFELRSNKR